MTKYIENKKTKRNKVNDVLDLKDISKAAWNFISAIYDLGWNTLIANKDNHTFRQNVSAQFTPKICEIKTNNKSDKNR